MNSNFFENFFIFFYFFGQNSFEFAKPSFFTKILQYIPRSLFLTVTVIILVRSIHFNPFGDKSEFIVYIMLLLLETIINLLVTFESILLPNAIPSLLNQYKYIKNYFEKRLNAKVPMKIFKWNFLVKVSLSVAVFLSMLATVRLTQEYKTSDAFMFLVSNYKHITAVHIMIYIDYLQHLLKTINVQFNTFQSEISMKVFDSNSKEMCYVLKTYKYVHFKLWKISQLINKRFGLILIALVLAFTLEVSYSAYWIIVFWLSNQMDSNMIRKY